MTIETRDKKRLLTRVCATMFSAAVLMLALLTGLVLMQVICRNYFDLGLPWADELARFSGIALVFFAIPKLLMENKHIRMDIFLNSLPPQAKGIAERLSHLLILVYCAASLFGFYKYLWRAAKFSTPALGMPNLIFYLPALLGMLALAAVAFYRIIQKTNRID